MFDGVTDKWKNKVNSICIVLLLAIMIVIQGCGTTAIQPAVIADMSDYEYKWGVFAGQKMADTTGSATLILDKKGNLYYFGEESPKPVIIMKDVKAFSLDDDSDTLGYTAPVAAILTESGDMYVCGDVSWGAAGYVNTLATPPENGEVPFTEPLLVNSNIKEISVGFRQMACITEDDMLYLSPSPYGLYERPENPTDLSEEEDISEYFAEHQNSNFVLDHTVQMGCGRSFFISVLEDGSVWSCFLPDSEEDVNYAKGYGEVMGDGSSELISNRPVCVFPAGTVF